MFRSIKSAKLKPKLENVHFSFFTPFTKYSNTTVSFRSAKSFAVNFVESSV